MRDIASARNKTVAQVAINYVITKGVIPIPGARNAKMVCERAREQKKERARARARAREREREEARALPRFVCV
jgi:diketogulonate reductase-like aldo/keto reductase